MSLFQSFGRIESRASGQPSLQGESLRRIPSDWALEGEQVLVSDVARGGALNLIGGVGGSQLSRCWRAWCETPQAGFRPKPNAAQNPVAALPAAPIAVGLWSLERIAVF